MPTEYRSVVTSPPDTVDTAHDFLVDVLDQRPDLTAAERMAITTILSELVTNVIQNNSHRAVSCEVKVRIEPSRLLVETSDTGDPTCTDPATSRMPTEGAESGRGLPLINLLADSVEHDWRDGRNVWTVARKR